MKIVIINAFGYSNRGDAVLLDSCINEIKQKYKKSEIIVSLFDDSGDQVSKYNSDVFCTTRIGNIPFRGIFGRFLGLWYLFVSLVGAFLKWKFIGRLLAKSQRNSFEAIAECDFVVSAPGGYIHDTNFAYLIALHNIFISILFGKDVYLAPQSVGPIDTSWGKFISRIVLSRCKKILARENYSYSYLVNKINLDTNLVIKSGDMAFWNYNVVKDENAISNELTNLGINCDSKIFGVTVVNWNFRYSIDGSKSRKDYIAKMAKIIDVISEKYNLVPVIFNQVDEDVDMAIEVAAAAKCRIIVDNHGRRPELLRALIGRSEVFLGTRFHSCIFAMMAGVPTYAISYLPKTENILVDLGLLGRSCPIDDINGEVVVDVVSEFFLKREDVGSQMRYLIDDYCKKHKRLSENI